MSPNSYNLNHDGRDFYMDNHYIADYPADSSIGLRPVISLKPGMPIASGTGTATDPYVIE